MTGYNYGSRLVSHGGAEIDLMKHPPATARWALRFWLELAEAETAALP